MPLPRSPACPLSRTQPEANRPNRDRLSFHAARKVRRRVAESVAQSGFRTVGSSDFGSSVDGFFSISSGWRSTFFSSCSVCRSHLGRTGTHYGYRAGTQGGSGSSEEAATGTTSRRKLSGRSSRGSCSAVILSPSATTECPPLDTLPASALEVLVIRICQVTTLGANESSI